MLWIGEQNMLLTKEIENIKKIATEAGEGYAFPKIDASKESYYIDYKCSIHQDETISEYSSDVISFKKSLLELWEDSDNSSFNKDVISSIMQTKDDEESVLEAIQLFNYMM